MNNLLGTWEVHVELVDELLGDNWPECSNCCMRVLVLHLLPDCLVVEGSTAVPVCDSKATANVATKNISDCTRCPGLDCIVARFASPGMLLLNVML